MIKEKVTRMKKSVVVSGGAGTIGFCNWRAGATGKDIATRRVLF